MAKQSKAPPIIVVFGDDDHQKETTIDKALDALLAPEVDRALALSTFEGDESPDQGGPTISRVLEDLATLPFLSDRRVVFVRNADAFISSHRERLEQYADRPAPTGVLVLECRTFPRTTRLYKATVATGGQVAECKKPVGRALIDFVVTETRGHKKRIDPAAAARLIDLVGQESGALATEIEKLCLYAADRETITDDDVGDLVGQSREEKVFAAAEAAALGRLPDALRMWHQVLDTDPAAVYRSLGGLAAKLRDWLTAHDLAGQGLPAYEIAPRVRMWRRERDLETLLQRQPQRRLRQALAAVADLDTQAKSGARSIETGVELLLVRLAAAAH